jgi:2-polyprenyl-3-methyl-5-hydroxy-6-metoxy-1,4-benzoquinol methylase
MWGTVPAGIDVARRSVENAARLGVDAHCCTLEEAPAHLMDLSVVTAIDLIEHLVEPQSFLAEVKRRLRPGGVAYLETPNIASNIYSVGQMLSRAANGRPASIFKRLFPPEHVQYFSRTGFEIMARKIGLELVSLQTRAIPFADIGTSIALRIAATSVQILDRASGNAVLLCIVVRRPR